ncbi:retrovirus-related pol polyprotein from transposon TNT 1-94 [Tanacetum coccineum]
MDVKSAFLNGLHEEEVYVEHQEGYVAKRQECKVLRLKKYLYHLKEAQCASNTRIEKPNILFVVGLITRFMKDPTTKHMKIEKRNLYYIKGTVDYGMFYSTSEDFNLVGYSDNDWDGNKDDGRSTTGFMFFLGNDAFTWSSKKEEVTVTIQNEIVAALSGPAEDTLRRNGERTNPHKVQLALIHLYDTASLWHRQFVKLMGENASWNSFKEAILLRFRSSYDDPMAKIKNLRHVGTIEEYQNNFDKLNSRVDLPED